MALATKQLKVVGDGLATAGEGHDVVDLEPEPWLIEVAAALVAAPLLAVAEVFDSLPVDAVSLVIGPEVGLHSHADAVVADHMLEQVPSHAEAAPAYWAVEPGLPLGDLFPGLADVAGRA